jgi:hypothetical protein
MLDNKIEVGKISGGVIDVVHIKRVGAQRVDRRSLAHMNVFDAKFQMFIGLVMTSCPTPAVASSIASDGR